MVRVKEDQSLRREGAHSVDVLCGDVMPRDNDDIELAAVSAKKLRNRAGVGMELNLHACLLQHCHVWLSVLQIVGDEGDFAAELHEETQYLLRALRPGI